jgi:hypothetical protein
MKYISLLMFLVSVTCSSLVYSQVGIKYDIDASNPMGVIAAMDNFYASSTGQSASGSVTLYQYVANGDNSATHAFIVAFPNFEEMQSTFTRNALSQDWATFLVEVNSASDQVSSVMFRSTGLNGGDPSKVTSPNPASYWTYISASDPSAYASAWQALTAQNSNVDITTGLSEILAHGKSDITHVVTRTANDLSSLLGTPNSDLNGWQNFVRSVSGTRTVITRDVLTRVKVWTNSN